MRQPGLLPSPAQASRTGDEAEPSPSSGAERRQSGGRARARDRLMDRASRTYPVSETLSHHARGVENLVLFIDDDLRETGLALGSVETYLVEILKLLEAPQMRREEVYSLAADTQVLDHVDRMVETLESLRRRLARLAASLR